MDYLIIIPLLVFLFSLFLSLALGRKEKGEKINVMQRLGQSVSLGEEIVNGKIVEQKGSFSERVIVPLARRIFELLAGLLPGAMTAGTEVKLKQAGFSSESAFGAFLAAMLLSGIVVPLLLCLMLPVSPAGWIIIFLLGWSLPGLYLTLCRRRRQEEIEKTLPDILDLLTVSVEAGLGFDGAVLKVTEKSRGILAEEFRRLIKENRMGKNRRDSLRDLAGRLGNDKVDTFTRSIIQAEQLGIGFANVLRLQAEQVRRQRKQRIEEAAMKAPVKMLIPLVLFIFPTIFIVLLGPAVLKIITIFQ
jgi:tight adherence protein C